MTYAKRRGPDVIDIVRTRELAVVDSENRPRCVISTYEKGAPILVMFDKKGETTLTITRRDEGSGVVTLFGKHESAASIQMDPLGGPSVYLQNPNGKSRTIEPETAGVRANKL